MSISFDRAAVAAYISSHIDMSQFKQLTAQKDELAALCAEADCAYMMSEGILDKDGCFPEEGEVPCYDDDDAYEFILAYVMKRFKVTGKQQDMVESFIDEYMELQEQYMEASGMLDWE